MSLVGLQVNYVSIAGSSVLSSIAIALAALLYKGGGEFIGGFCSLWHGATAVFSAGSKLKI